MAYDPITHQIGPRVTADRTHLGTLARPQLLPIIAERAPEATPILSMLPIGEAEDMTVEWHADLPASYPAKTAAVQAQIPGTEAEASAVTSPYKIFSYVHFFREVFSAVDATRKIKTVGVDNYVERTLNRRELKQGAELEHALLNSTLTVGVGLDGETGATAPKMAGLFEIAKDENDADTTLYGGADPWAIMNGETDLQGSSYKGVGSPVDTLTAKLLEDLLETMWGKGVTANLIFCNSVQKRYIDGFWGTRPVITDLKHYQRLIDVYETSFGLQTVRIHRRMRGGHVLLLDPSYLAFMALEPGEFQLMAKTGDMDCYMLQSSGCLRVNLPAAVGLAHNLYNTYV